jgi:hypothetical protein
MDTAGEDDAQGRVHLLHEGGHEGLELQDEVLEEVGGAVGHLFLTVADAPRVQEGGQGDRQEVLARGEELVGAGQRGPTVTGMILRLKKKKKP